MPVINKLQKKRDHILSVQEHSPVNSENSVLKRSAKIFGGVIFWGARIGDGGDFAF